VRVVLVGPSQGRSDRIAGFISPPLGVHRIAGWLRSESIRCDVVDPVIDAASEIERLFSLADVVGVSTTYWTFGFDLEVARTAKEVGRCLVVFGGVHASLAYEDVLSNDCVDAVCMGEGEVALASFVNGLAGGGVDRALSTKGMAVVRDGVAVRNSPSSPLTGEQLALAYERIDVKSMPYEAYWDRMEEGYKDPPIEEIRSIRVVSGNKCPYSCSFCSSPMFLDFSYECKVRVERVSEDSVLGFIDRALASHDVRQVVFSDDNFFIPRRSGVSLLRAIISKRLADSLWRRLRFTVITRVDQVSKSILDLMASAGVRVVCYGVESYSNSVLAEFQKGFTSDKADFAIDASLSAGIGVFANVILFSPMTTVEDIKSTAVRCVDWIEMGVDIAVEPFVIPIPGTKMFADYPGGGERIMPRDAGALLVADRFLGLLSGTRDSVCGRFAIEHVPTRLNGLIALLAVDSAAGFGLSRRLDAILEKKYGA